MTDRASVKATLRELGSYPGRCSSMMQESSSDRSSGAAMQYPSVVIAVENVKRASEKIISAGGKVLGEPMEIPGVGQYVSFTDPEGNRVSLLQPLPRTGKPSTAKASAAAGR